MTLQIVAGNANVQIQMDGNDVLAVSGNLSVFNESAVSVEGPSNQIFVSGTVEGGVAGIEFGGISNEVTVHEIRIEGGGRVSTIGVSSNQQGAIRVFEGNHAIDLTNAGTILSSAIGVLGGGFDDRIVNSETGSILGGVALRAGNDVVINDGLLDFAVMGDGNDIVINRGTSNLGQSFDLGSGDDVFDARENVLTINMTVRAGDGNDIIRGGGSSGAALLDGEAGDDFIAPSVLKETIRGGDGFDTVSFAEYGNPLLALTVDLADPGANSGAAKDDLYQSIERFVGSDFADTFRGDGDGNDLQGGKGNDALSGSGGSDILTGGEGSDTMAGGAGNDVFVITDTFDTVIELAGEGTDEVRASVSYTLKAHVENLIGEGTAALILTGNTSDNTIEGNAAANVIDGAAGADIMRGGAGNDLYVVDNAGDQVTEIAGGGTDTVSSGISHTLEANVENLIGTGAAALTLTGNTSENAIDGNAAANVIDGAAGADIMRGGAGNDLYVVDNAGDQIAETAGGGTDTVSSGVSLTLAAAADIEVVQSSDASATTALRFEGNGLAQTISGNAGRNQLLGNAGNDKLFGGAGADVLTGGAGNDTFVFNTALLTTGKTAALKKANLASNIDRIVDFKVVNDTFQLENAFFKALGRKTGKMKADFFKIGKATDKNDHIVYNDKTGALFYDVDGNGGKAGIQVATVAKKLKITSLDFVVI